jgi:3-oxoacyl-[acyl-carrier protein] reductase
MDKQIRTAIVTGGSRGIGRSIALRLAADGFAVVINYANNSHDAAAAAAEIKTKGGQAIAVQGNVALPDDVKRLFDEAEKAFGGVDVLVNNGGIMKLATLANSTDALFDEHVAVNFKGTFNGLREGIKRLRSDGRIINLSSSVVALRFEQYGIYAATKAAVETLTAIAAKELRGRNITVNAVAPGPTGTDLFLNGKPAEVIERLAKAPPLERLGTPEDIAAVVAFLAGPDGAWVNGQTIRANGGII